MSFLLFSLNFQKKPIGGDGFNHSPGFFKEVSFHVPFHVKFGNLRCYDFSANNPQNSCLVT